MSKYQYCALSRANTICMLGTMLQHSDFPGCHACAFLVHLEMSSVRIVCLTFCSAHLMDLLQNGEALIKYGERGDKLYLIRYGKVRILRPDDSAPGGRVEVAKLGRGNLVGERTVVTGMSYSLLHTICTSASSALLHSVLTCT